MRRMFNGTEWRGCPDLNTNATNLERDFARFLNDLAMKCARSMGVGVDPPMRWTAKYSTNILPGHQANRKPDLTLFTHDTNNDWRCVRSICEMKSHRSHTDFAELMDQVSGEIIDHYTNVLAYIVFVVKSAIIFGSQDSRNYVIALGFAKYDIVIYKYV
jgi:hypothetical protein